MTCDKCGGSGVDETRACSSLAMPGMNAYIAAMYPCPRCGGSGAYISDEEKAAGDPVGTISPRGVEGVLLVSGHELG